MARETKNEDRKQRIRDAFQEGQAVERMPAREDMQPQNSEDVELRVAPYCRVSTMSEMQAEAERFRVRDAHTPLVSKEDWREVKNRVSMPDREAVILEDITGEGVLAELHPIQFKEDVDI